MLAAGVQFLVCATVIIVAGTFLTRFADAIAELTKLGRLVIGSVLLASATSLPELTVDISAIRMGMPDLAVGDLLGFGVSHPCTTFDKWQLLYVVDDAYTAVAALKTCF